MQEISNPLLDPPPAEIPLPRAPLVLVVAQVRFPQITSVSRSEFIGPFQEAIRHDYPILRQESIQDFLINPTRQTAKSSSSKIWRFSEDDGPWRVSLSEAFIALETKQYSSRDDFLSRLERILEAFEEHVAPKRAERVGIRYVDRLAGEDAEDMPNLVRPELAGILATEVARMTGQAVSQHLFTLGGADRLVARWGRLPAGRTIDPNTIEPVDTPSWLLDLDAFRAESMPFSSEELTAQARGFAERIYTFFRWAVTPAFLTRFGGEV